MRVLKPNHSNPYKLDKLNTEEQTMNTREYTQFEEAPLIVQPANYSFNSLRQMNAMIAKGTRPRTAAGGHG